MNSIAFDLYIGVIYVVDITYARSIKFVGNQNRTVHEQMVNDDRCDKCEYIYFAGVKNCVVNAKSKMLIFRLEQILFYSKNVWFFFAFH